MFLTITIISQSPWDSLWLYRTGRTNSDELVRLRIDSEGNIIATGHAFSIYTSYDLMVVKVDSSGNLLWERTFDGPGDDTDYSHAITIDSSGNYVITGPSKSFSITSGFDIWILRLDSGTGDTLWTKALIWSDDDISTDLLTLPDGNILLTGYIFSFDGTADAILIKLDITDGDTLKFIRYPSAGYDDRIMAMAMDPDGNLVLAGSRRDSSGQYDGLIMKVDSSGSIIWTVFPGGSGDDYIRDVMVDEGGFYVLTGHTTSASDSFDVWIMKVDPSDGTILWSRTPGTIYDDYSYSIFQDSQDHHIVSGYTDDPSLPGTDALFYMLNSGTGSVVDSAIVNIEGDDIIRDGAMTPQGNFVFAGLISYPDDGMIIKTRGTPIAGQREVAKENYLIPAAGGFIVLKDTRIKVFQSTGKLIMEGKFTEGQRVRLRSEIYLLQVDGGPIRKLIAY